MFSQWKAFLKRHQLEFNLNWYEVHSEALTLVTPYQGLNYFKNTTLVELVNNHPLSDEYKNRSTILAILLLAVES